LDRYPGETAIEALIRALSSAMIRGYPQCEFISTEDPLLAQVEVFVASSPGQADVQAVVPLLCH
jgi:hypothetical protein